MNTNKYLIFLMALVVILAGLLTNELTKPGTNVFKAESSDILILESDQNLTDLRGSVDGLTEQEITTLPE
jgi:hypothetical protein